VRDPRFREIRDVASDGQSLSALINGDLGWLMYQRGPDDPGFSSRNPNYAGVADATIEYVLGNGQRDEYPAAWAFSTSEVLRALEYFRVHRQPPPFASWHNDSADGVVFQHAALTRRSTWTVSLLR
jgi:hypothetical protein